MFPDVECRFLGSGYCFKLSTVAAEFKNSLHLVQSDEPFSSRVRDGVSGEAGCAAGSVTELEQGWTCHFLTGVRKYKGRAFDCISTNIYSIYYCTICSIYCLQKVLRSGNILTVDWALSHWRHGCGYLQIHFYTVCWVQKKRWKGKRFGKDEIMPYTTDLRLRDSLNGLGWKGP